MLPECGAAIYGVIITGVPMATASNKLLYMGIVHTNTAERDCAADGVGLVGAMNAITRAIKSQPAAAKDAGIGEDFFY